MMRTPSAEPLLSRPAAPPALRTGRGRPLPAALRRALEALSGLAMDDVRVHRGSALPALLGARAFAWGCEVFLGPGAEDALAHEAWHVVQQKQGRAAATGTINGVPLNGCAALEAEAHAMGRRAERLAAAGGVGGAGLRRAGVARPVVQRWIVVGDNAPPKTAAEVRAQLAGAQVPMTEANTPHLRAALDDMDAANLTFADWDALRAEVRRRSFGRRHVGAIETLQARHDNLRATYATNNGFTRVTPAGTVVDTDRLEVFLKTYRDTFPRSRQRVLNDEGVAAPTFVFWNPKLDLASAETRTDVRRNQVYVWITAGQSFPKQMNCWECVLLSGTWSNQGALVPLYSRDYALWAIQSREIPLYALGAHGMEPVPLLVERIVNNAVYHATAIAPDRVSHSGQNYPALPARVAAGSILVFNRGQHVALATGRTRNNARPHARAIYGNAGHELVELDGATSWIANATIEDTISRGYTNEIHIGWLPEVAAQEQITLLDKTQNPHPILHQVNLPVTRFYTG